MLNNNFCLDPKEISPDDRLAALAEAFAEGFMCIAEQGALGEFQDTESGSNKP